jgi:hypothetical protein
MRDVKLKQPSEVLDYDVEYGDWLPDGDALSTAGAATDSTDLVIDSTQVWISGGIDGAQYKVTVTATTNDGRVKEADFTIRVRNF